MFEFIRRLRVLFSRKDKLRLLLIGSLMSLGAFAELIGVGLVLPPATVFLDPDSLNRYPVLHKICEIFRIESVSGFLFFASAVLLTVFALKNLFLIAVLKVQSSFVGRKRAEFGVRLQENYLKAPYSYLTGGSTAEFNTKAGWIYDFASYILLPAMMVLSDGAVLLILLIALGIFLPGLLLAAVLVLLGGGAAVYLMLRRGNRKYGRRYAEADAALKKILLESLENVKYVKLAGAEDYFLRRCAVFQQTMGKTYAGMYVLGQLPRLTLEFIALALLLGFFAALLAAGWDKEQILLYFSLLLALLARLLPAASRFHYNLTLIRQYLPIFDVLYGDFTGIKREIDPETEKNPEMTLENALELKKVSFTYPDGGKKIFENFDFSLKAGECVGITGSTGRGKSTLIDLVCGLLNPDSGKVLSDGREISENPVSWRRLLSVTPQRVFLLNGSVAENVAFGEDIPDREKVIRALKKARIGELADKLDMNIGDDGGKLSGGQRQRLALARAFYRENARLLIFDEATSALDADTEKELIDGLAEIKGKIAMLIISHRPGALALCDRVVNLDGID